MCPVKDARDARRAEARAIVDRGVCPLCGTKLVRNITLAGWYQCGASGAVGFRGAYDGSGKRDASLDLLPACSYQVFV